MSLVAFGMPRLFCGDKSMAFGSVFQYWVLMRAYLKRPFQNFSPKKILTKLLALSYFFLLFYRSGLWSLQSRASKALTGDGGWCSGWRYRCDTRYFGAGAGQQGYRGSQKRSWERAEKVWGATRNDKGVQCFRGLLTHFKYTRVTCWDTKWLIYLLRI